MYINITNLYIYKKIASDFIAKNVFKRTKQWTLGENNRIVFRASIFTI